MLSSLPYVPIASGGSVLLAILGIGFLIFVHELGHYLACRLTKTRVETFSIGFGTRLFGWENKPGEPKRFTLGRRRLDPADHAMDFRVALVPLGGYVKMAGENPGEERSGSPDEFPSKSLGARVFIISAGVIMNVITAWVFYVIAYGSHIEQQPAMFGSVEAGGPAWEAGLEAGDRLHSLAGKRTRSFIDLKYETVLLAPDRPTQAVVERDGERFERDVIPRKDEKMGAVRLNVLSPETVTIRQGERSLDILPQDEVRLNGVPVTGGQDLEILLRSALGEAQGQLRFELRTEKDTPWILEWNDVRSKPDRASKEAEKKAYKVGIALRGHPVVKAVRGKAAEVVQVGDRIVAAHAGGERIEIATSSTWAGLVFREGVSRLEIERDGARLEVPVPGGTPASLQAWLSDLHARLPDENAGGLQVEPLPAGTIALATDGKIYRYPASPAADAGLRAGDAILKMGDKDVSKWDEVIAFVTAVTEPKPVAMVVRGTDGKTRTLQVSPVPLVELEGPEFSIAQFWEPYETEGLLDTLSVAFQRTGQEIRRVFGVIVSFFSGRLDFQKNIGGPVTIVVASSQQVNQSWLHFLTFLAYISVTLAVLNILPIPVLDGGHLMFILIEKIKGSPLKEETIGKFQFAGLMLLLLLMVFAFKNDVGLLLR